MQKTARPPALSSEQINVIAKALADPRRFEILEQIGARPTGIACSELRECQPVSAPTMSHHLKELEAAGLISVAKDGKFLNLRLNRPVLRAYSTHLAKI